MCCWDGRRGTQAGGTAYIGALYRPPAIAAPESASGNFVPLVRKAYTDVEWPSGTSQANVLMASEVP